MTQIPSANFNCISSCFRSLIANFPLTQDCFFFSNSFCPAFVGMFWAAMKISFNQFCFSNYTLNWVGQLNVQPHLLNPFHHFFLSLFPFLSQICFIFPRETTRTKKFHLQNPVILSVICKSIDWVSDQYSTAWAAPIHRHFIIWLKWFGWF